MTVTNLLDTFICSGRFTSGSGPGARGCQLQAGPIYVTNIFFWESKEMESHNSLFSSLSLFHDTLFLYMYDVPNIFEILVPIHSLPAYDSNAQFRIQAASLNGARVLQIQNWFQESQAGRQCKGRQPRIFSPSTRAPS